VVTAALLLVTIVPQTPPGRVLLWTGLLVPALLARGLLFYQFRRCPPATDASVRRVHNRFVVIVGLGGVAYGLAGVLLFPADDPTLQMFIVFVIAGMAAGAPSTLAASWRATMAYLFGMVAPVTVVLFLQRDYVATIMSSGKALMQIINDLLDVSD